MKLTIDSIELRNYGSHRQETVTFPKEGIVLLWGPSGAGKTSLLESAAFALFGVNATRASSLQELRHELYPDEDFGVRLTLDAGNDHKIQVYRGVEGGKSIAWLADSDGHIVEGLKPVAAKVAELLGGMDGPTFFATYFSQQGELDALVRKAGGERRKFVQRMLGISLLDKVSTRINKEITKAGERVTFLDESMPKASRDELTEQLAAARAARDSAQARTEALAAELEAAGMLAADLREQAQAGKQAADRHAHLVPAIAASEQTRLPALQQELDRARETLTAAEQAAQRVNDNADLAQEITTLRAEADTLAAAEGAAAALERLKAETQTAQRAEVDRRAELDAVPAAKAGEDPQALASERDGLLARWNSLGERVGELNANRAKLVDDGVCFTCRRPLDEDGHDPLAALDEQIAGIEAERERIVAAGKDIKQRLDAAQQAHQAAQAAERARAQAATRLEEAQNTHARLRAHLDEAQDASANTDAQRLRTVRARLEELAEQAAQLNADTRLAAGREAAQTAVAAAEAALADEQAKLDRARGEVAALNFDPDAYEQLVAQAAEATKTHADLREQSATAHGQARDAARDEQQASHELERYEAIVADRARADEKHATLKRLDATMRAFKVEMVGQIRPGLEARASQHLNELSDGKMPAVQIDDEYNMAIKRSGGFRRVGLCSGGELARAAFALRLALTEMVAQRTDTPVGFLVFDEIFGSQDPDHRHAIMDALCHVRALWPQTFLISHEEELRDHHLVDVIVDVPDSDSAGRIQVTSR